MRRTSPCTLIIGGNPEDKCRSDALFLTTKASNSVRSITIPPSRRKGFFAGISGHYGNNCRQPASDPERLGPVTLLAASKGQSVEKIREAVAAGQRAFGENYVQEAL